MLKVKRTSRLAKLPSRASPGSIGYDLCAIEDGIVPKSNGVLAVNTGVVIETPQGTYGRIAPRSGLALKHGIDVLAGVIDPDYRGDVKVLLLNTSSQDDYEVKAGDRIAQLVLEQALVAPVLEVHEAEELATTARDAKGFGSSGV